MKSMVMANFRQRKIAGKTTAAVRKKKATSLMSLDRVHRKNKADFSA